MFDHLLRISASGFWTGSKVNLFSNQTHGTQHICSSHHDTFTANYRWTADPTTDPTENRLETGLDILALTAFTMLSQ